MIFKKVFGLAKAPFWICRIPPVEELTPKEIQNTSMKVENYKVPSVRPLPATTHAYRNLTDRGQDVPANAAFSL